MGGAFSKKGSKRDKDPRTQDKQNRRLSVSGIAQGPQGDSNTTGTVTDKGQNEYLRFSALSNAGYEPDGHKKTNQDAFISFVDFGESSVSVFGVFDGHGACGHHVSAYVRREIPRSLDKELLKAESAQARANIDSVAKHFIQVFERVNNTLEADKSIDSSLSGTTAVAAIILGRAGNRKIITANAGDSRVIIGYEEGGQLKAKELSEDQKPDLECERQRILKCGGRVEPLIDENGEPIGPHRVWLPNMMLPGLAMARSIGDDIAATVGVHATPEIKVHDLTDRDRFMVVASDGVWEFLSSEDVVEIVKGCAGDADRACQEICARSYREWRAEEEVVDDITAIVVYFTKV